MRKYFLEVVLRPQGDILLRNFPHFFLLLFTAFLSFRFVLFYLFYVLIYIRFSSTSSSFS